MQEEESKTFFLQISDVSSTVHKKLIAINEQLKQNEFKSILKSSNQTKSNKYNDKLRNESW